MRHELNEAFDETLQQSAYRLLPLAIHDVRELQQDETHQVPGLDQPGDENYFTYFVRDRDGRTIVRGDNAPPELAAVTLQERVFRNRWQASLRRHRRTHPAMASSFSKAPTTVTRRLLESIAALAWPLLGLLPLIALGIWVAIRLAMRPVERLRRDIESRDSRNLAPLAIEGHPVELAPIAQAVASLIDRLKTGNGCRAQLCRQQRARIAHPDRRRPGADAATGSRARPGARAMNGLRKSNRR